MNIAFLTPSNVAGGAERVMSSLANYLASDNDISLIIFENKSFFYEIEESVSCYYIGINTEGKKPFQKYILFPSCVQRLRKILKDISPDIVISFLYITNVTGIVCCRFLKTPIIISERNDPTKYPLLRRLAMKLIYPMATGIVCQSRKVQDYYKTEYKITKSTVIENPLNLNQVGAFHAHKSNTIISVGRLIPQKNFSLLIRAFSEIYEKFPDYKLVIFGEGPLRIELEGYISHLNMKEHIFLPGVEIDAIKKHSDACLFVLSSNFEGYPNVLIEAMASGIPCIAADVQSGTVRQVIQDGFNGYTFPVGNLQELKDRMIKVLGDEGLSFSMAVNARKIFEDNSIDEIAGKWTRYMIEIMSKSYGGHDL